TRGLRAAALPPHPTSRSRTYAEVRDHAAAAVAGTPKPTLLEMGRKVVIPEGALREDLISAFDRTSAEFRGAAAAWNEDAMDRHALRHPLLGEMTVREMLFFFVVHERHHLRLVQKREGSS